MPDFLWILRLVRRLAAWENSRRPDCRLLGPDGGTSSSSMKGSFSVVGAKLRPVTVEPRRGPFPRRRAGVPDAAG